MGDAAVSLVTQSPKTGSLDDSLGAWAFTSAVIDAMVQPIPVDAVIVALASDLLSLNVAAAGHPPPPTTPEAAMVKVTSRSLNSVESCQSSHLSPLPTLLRPGTLAASRGQGNRSGSAFSRPCVAATLCQLWRSASVSWLLAMA